nr:hypothetical protein [Saprospiraceae bacterium]
ILWSIWSSTTMGNWASVAKYAFTGSLTQFLFLFFGLLALWLMGSVIYRVFALRQWGKIVDPNPKSGLATLWSVGMISLLLLLYLQPVQKGIEQFTSIELDGFMLPKLSYADENLLVEGYYEEILIGNELTNPVGEMVERGEGGRFRFSEAAVLVDDIRAVTSKPNTQILFKGKSYSVNQYGNRDREYPTEPGENTIRTAILGGSYPNGSGIADRELFDRILEDSINKMVEGLNYEFWNFSHPGYDLIPSIYDFEVKEAEQYQFDNLIFISHGVDMFKNIKTLADHFLKGTEMPYPYLEDIIKKSGINKSMSSNEMFKSLEPYSEELVRKSYTHLYELCKKNEIKPIWMYWPTTAIHPFVRDYSSDIAEMVSQIGYTVIDLSEVYREYKPTELYVSPSDRHPNVLGHSLIADALVDWFIQRPELLNPSPENNQ